jgi:aerobic-type carbon monoxide dehydrogenase small subunit (CoxS/CutS family)
LVNKNPEAPMTGELQPDAEGLFSVLLDVNGSKTPLRVHPEETLLETLRHRMDLFSVRESCGLGICGACTVLLDGRAASACILLAVAAVGRTVTTSEGLLDNGGINRVQQAFVQRQAFQCSYCIPGMVLAVQACLDEHPEASEEAVRDHLGGNLCRCGTYPQVLEAVRDLTTSAGSDEGTGEPNTRGWNDGRMDR